MLKKDGNNKKGLAVWRLFLAGFLLGVIVPNILWKTKWLQNTSLGIYVLGTLAGSDIHGTEYFLEVLRLRGSYFLLAFFCGISVFGVPFSVLGMVISGMKTGILLSLSILQFGLAGGAVGLGLLFPQYLAYIPAWAYLSALMYGQSMEIWRNRGLFPLKVYRYCIRVFLIGLLYIVGMALEVFLNPWVVENLIKKLIIL